MAVVVITGTSSGIGLATALHFARRGDRVFATMRDLARDGALRQAAVAEQLSLTILALDVTDEDSVNRAVSTVLEQAGRLDVLVNNAALMHYSAVEHTTDALARAVFETNVFGPLRAIRAVLPTMRAQRSGAIVNVSSVAGRITFACGGLYMMSKHALEAASEALAREVRPYSIRVALVEPGFTATPMLERAVAGLAAAPESPYAAAEQRLLQMHARLGNATSDPRLIAEAIEQAVTTPRPRLRYLVGVRAQELVDAYERGRGATTPIPPP